MEAPGAALLSPPLMQVSFPPFRKVVSEPMKPHGDAAQFAVNAGGAPQPAENTADASQLGGLPIVRLKVSGNGRGKKTFFHAQAAFFH